MPQISEPIKKFYLWEHILAATMTYSVFAEVTAMMTETHSAGKFVVKDVHGKITKPIYQEMFDVVQLFTFLFIFVVKYYKEGFRFNVIVACASEIFFFVDRASAWEQRQLLQISAMLVLFYNATIFYMPVYELPEPTGPYKVGFKVFRVDDNYHTTVSAYYPCVDKKIDEDNQEKIGWFAHERCGQDIFQSVEQRQGIIIGFPEWMIKWTLNYIWNYKLKVNTQAEIVDNYNKQECYIYSHGLLSHRHSQSALLSQMASEGNVCFAIEHQEMVYPWDDKNSKIQKYNNSAEIIEKYQKIRSKHCEWRVEQVQGLIDYLTLASFVKDRLFSKMESFKNFVVIGHSFGGASVLQAATLDKRIKKVVAFDPWMLPLSQKTIDHQFNQRVLCLMQERELFEKSGMKEGEKFKKLVESNKGNKANFAAFKLKGLDHASFSDWPFIMSGEMRLMGQSSTSVFCKTQFETYYQTMSAFLWSTEFESGKSLEEDLGTNAKKLLGKNKFRLQNI